MVIVNQTVRDLVLRIDTTPRFSPDLTAYVQQLVRTLKARCSAPEVQARYDAYRNAAGGVLEKYPSDADGYAVSYDPLTDEESFISCWERFGIVVSKSVISPMAIAGSVGRIHELMRDISNGQCELSNPKTWNRLPVDESGVPILSRGFFEIYHDELLCRLRQAVRVYLHYVLIWGRPDLWTSFDRLGVKLPGHEESAALPLHVDQNPLVHAGFRTVQGVLALSDCPAERGTFVGVPGSKLHFGEYGAMAQNRGEYVELDKSALIAGLLQQHAQVLPLRAGDLISWDSRTTHANSANVSKDTRLVAYISAGPAREESSDLVKAREDGFASGLGSNVRDALMHASKPPRYTNSAAVLRVRKRENLTLLGRLLYGKSRYADID